MPLLPTPIPHPLDNDIFQAPDGMRTALEWVVGIEWPAGNELAMRELAEQWYAAGKELGPLLAEADMAALHSVAAFGGPDQRMAAAILDLWRVIGGGEESALLQVQEWTTLFGEWVAGGANEIEAVKIEFYIELGLLLIELIAIAVMAFATMGAALTAAGPAMFATRCAIQMALRRGAKKLLERSIKKTITDRIKDRITSKAGRIALDLGDDALEEALQEGLTSLGTQTYQINEGNRGSLDWTDIGASAALGGLGGGVASLASLGSGAKSLLGKYPDKMLRGAGGEILAEVTIGLVTGQGVDLTSLGMAATSGASGSYLGVKHHDLNTTGLLALNASLPSAVNLPSAAASIAAAGSGNFPLPTGVSPASGDTGGSGILSSPAGSPPLSGTVPDTPATSTSAPATPAPSTSTPTPTSGFTATDPIASPTGSTGPAAVDTGYRPNDHGLVDRSAADYGPSAGLQGIVPTDPTSAVNTPTGSQPGPVSGPVAPGPDPGAAGPGSGGGPVGASVPGPRTSEGVSSSANPAVDMSPAPTTEPGVPPGSRRRPADPAGVPAADSGDPVVVVAATSRLAPPGMGPGTANSAHVRALIDDDPLERALYSDRISHEIRTRLKQRLSRHVDTLIDRAQDRIDQLTWDIRRAETEIEQQTRERPDSEPDVTVLRRLLAEQDEQRDWRDRLRSDDLRALAPEHLAEIHDELWQIAQDDHGAGAVRLATGGVIDHDTSRLTGTDTPPPVESSRRYGEPGGYRPPLALHQQDLELAVERDEAGRPKRFPNLLGDWLKLVNDHGPNADPTRSNNCPDVALCLLDLWLHGRPRVAAPRTIDHLTVDDSLHPLGGEPDGAHRVERHLGAHFQQLMGDQRDSDPELTRAMQDQGFHRLERTLRQAGHGAIAVLIHEYPGGGSHMINVVNQGGEIHYVDAQDPAHPLRTGRPAGATRMDAIVLGPDATPQDLGTPPGHWSRLHDSGMDVADPEGLHRAESVPGINPDLMMRDATEEQLRELGVGTADITDLGYPDLAGVPEPLRAGIAAALPHMTMADLAQISFTQRSVSPATSDGIPASDLSKAFQQTGWRGAPVHVVRFGDGSLVSLDHRRLRAARLAGVERVPVVVHQPSDPLANWPTEFTRAQRRSLRLTHDIHHTPDGRWVTDPVDPSDDSRVFSANRTPRSWGEFAIFRSANQRSLLPGSLFGTPTPPVILDMPPASAAGTISDDDRAALQQLCDRAEREADQTQHDLLAAARSVDPDIRPYGLDHRVKSIESLTRKFRNESERSPQTGEQFAATVNDALRFSLVMHDGPRYAGSVAQTLEAMLSQGYQVMKRSVKNFWVPGNRHYGVNATLSTRDGLEFELQFPTELSAEMGRRTHEFYEITRDDNERPSRRVHALLRMLSINKELDLTSAIPPGVVDAFGSKPAGFADWVAVESGTWHDYIAWLDLNGVTFGEIAAEFDLNRRDFPISPKAERGLTDAEIGLLRDLPE